MIRTMDDTTSGTGTVTGGPGAGRCLWDESVCVDNPLTLLPSCRQKAPKLRFSASGIT